MGYQFIHIESYARQAGKGKDGENNISKVAGEADRLEGNTKHLPTPQPPMILYGVSASKVAEMAEDWADEAKDSRGHKLRKDGLCLVAGVISVPNDLTDKEWADFKIASFDWLVEMYGDRLKSIIEHTDEPFRHFHFYVIPNPDEKFEVIHQGKKAASEVKQIISEDGENKKGAQNSAYKEAMKAYQDEFFKKVGMKSGLLRLGPGKRRLTRKAYLEETRQAKYFANAQAQHDGAKKRGYQSGKKLGYERGKQKFVEQNNNFGARLGGVLAGVIGGLHRPTSQAVQQVQKANEETEKQKRLRVQEVAKAKQEADRRVVASSNREREGKEVISNLEKDIKELKKSTVLDREKLLFYEKKFGVPSDLPKLKS